MHWKFSQEPLGESHITSLHPIMPHKVLLLGPSISEFLYKMNSFLFWVSMQLSHLPWLNYLFRHLTKWINKIIALIFLFLPAKCTTVWSLLMTSPSFCTTLALSWPSCHSDFLGVTKMPRISSRNRTFAYALNLPEMPFSLQFSSLLQTRSDSR